MEKKKITGFVKNIQNKFYGIVDEIRLLKIKKHRDWYDAIDLKKDSSKVEALQYFDNFYEKKAIMDYIYDYDAIVQGLQNFTETEKRMLKIPTKNIDNDVKKIELVNVINNNKMIESLASVLKIFKEISSECDKSIALCDEEKKQTIASREEILKESIVKTTTSEINAEETFNILQKKIDFVKDAMNLPTDEEKIKSISNISSDYLKSKVISTLEDEDKKIEYISLLKNDIAKLNIVASLPDVKKIKYLDLFEEEDQLSIMTSIQDDNIKMDNLFIFEDNIDYLVYVARTLKEDENKIKAIKIISDIDSENEMILRLIINIKNPDLKIKAAKKNLDVRNMETFLMEYRENYKGNLEFKEMKDLIKRLHKLTNTINDIAKVREIEKMDNENLKLDIALSIKSNKIKSDVIGYFSDENKKVTILENIKDKEYIKEIIGNEKRIKELGFDIQRDLPKLVKATEDSEYINNFLKSIETKQNIKDNNQIVNLPNNMTIGIEIESEGINSNLIKATNNKFVDGWECKGDTSIRNGVEIVSPVLSGNKEHTSEAIKNVCERLNRLRSDRI